MRWVWIGRLAVVLFGVMAVSRAFGPDPILWVLVYLGAAATALSVARGRRVVRWALVILIVFPIEMALISLPLSPWPLQQGINYPGAAPTAWDTVRDVGGMTLVALWSTFLVATRRFQSDGTERAD